MKKWPAGREDAAIVSRERITVPFLKRRRYLEMGIGHKQSLTGHLVIAVSQDIIRDGTVEDGDDLKLSLSISGESYK